MKYYATVTTVDSRAQAAEFVIEIDGEQRITVNDQPQQIDFQNLPHEGFLSLLLNNQSVEGVVESRDVNVWEVLIHGELYTVAVQDERSYRLAKARAGAAGVTGEATLKSPMPGVVSKIPVQVGDAVHKQTTLVILESMKMENELRAPREGVVLRIHVAPGATVDKGAALVVVGDPPAMA